MSHWLWKDKEITHLYSLCLMSATLKSRVFHKYASISGLDAIWFIGRDNATWFLLLLFLTLSSCKLQICYNTYSYNAVFVAGHPHSHCLHTLGSCITFLASVSGATSRRERCCPLSCVCVCVHLGPALWTSLLWWSIDQQLSDGDVRCCLWPLKWNIFLCGPAAELEALCHIF